MAGTTGYSELLGDFIDAWDSNVIESFVQSTPLLDLAKFERGHEQGGIFHAPLRATIESGTTFSAPRINPGDSNTPYVGARSGYVPDYQIEAPSIHGRSRVSYEALARSMDSVDANSPDKKKAVQDATSLITEGLFMGTMKKCEALMLHGRRGLGTAEAASSVVAASTVAGNELANPFDGNAAGFIIDVRVSAATWAEAIYVQSEGGTFDLWSNVAGVPTAKLNVSSNTVLTSGVNQTGAVLTAINPPTPQTGLNSTDVRVLRFFHSSGTLGGSGSGVLGGAAQLAISTSFIFYESGSPTTEYVSLTAMARNTGTIFNVPSTQYSVAKGNFQDAAGNLKLADVVRYLARPINKGAGAKGSKRIIGIIPTEAYIQYANDESTLRRYGAETSKARNGFGNLEMYLPGNGTILELIGHNLQKDGEQLFFPSDEIKRIGSQDLDFIKRGSDKNSWILEVSQSPTSEARIYGQFAPLMQAPSHMLALGGVTF